MGLRIRGGRRGHFNNKNSQLINARGRCIAVENRSQKINGSPYGNAIERRKINEEMNQSLLKTFDHFKSVADEEEVARNIHLELEKTVNLFDVDIFPSKSSDDDDDDDRDEVQVLRITEESGSKLPIHGVMKPVNGNLSKNVDSTHIRTSEFVKSQVHHTDGTLKKSGSQIQNAYCSSGKNKDKSCITDSSQNDLSYSIKPEFFYSKEHHKHISEGKPLNSDLTYSRNENFCTKKNFGLSQHRIASLGKQKNYKFFNKLSKRNRLNLYKLSSDRNLGVKRMTQSFNQERNKHMKALIDDSGRNRRQFQQKSPKKCINSYNCSNKFVKEMDLESCPGTSSGNQVITSRDMSTLPMILRNSVMTQNSDSEKDDDEDLIESNASRNKNGANEVIDVIDGIEFVAFENEHEMVQFTRLVSDESCKCDLNDMGFSSEFPEAIILKKTKDIKKIKGWQRKKFTITQNPMADSNSSESELAVVTDLCPDSIEYEHNYMRRQLENKEYDTDCEDEIAGLPLDRSDFSITEDDDMGKLEDNLNKVDKISVWKPSEKSAFVSYSMPSSDMLTTSLKDDETGSNTRSAFENHLEDSTKMDTCVNSEQQSIMERPNIRSIATLSPTSILMNKIRRQNAMRRDKIIMINRSVQVNLPNEYSKTKRKFMKQRTLEDELCVWSQSFEDVWHVDKKRALFAVSAVIQHESPRGKCVDTAANKLTGQTTLLRKPKHLQSESVCELPSQRRLLRSSTKKKTTPIRLTRSSINSLQSEVLDFPSLSCISKPTNHRKSIDAHASLEVSLNSRTSPTENLSSPDLVNNIATTTSPSVGQPIGEIFHVKTPPVDSSEVSSSFSRTLDSPSHLSEGVQNPIQDSKGEPTVHAPPKSTPQKLQSTSRHEEFYEYRRRRKARRKLLARKIWIIRRMRKLKELGILGPNLNGEVPSIADLNNDELKKYSYLDSIRIDNGKMVPDEAEVDKNASANLEVTQEENLAEKKTLSVVKCSEKGSNINNNSVEKVNLEHKNSISPIIWERGKECIQGKECVHEMENEELRVFLKPKPRLQAKDLSPMKTSLEPSVLFTSSNHSFEHSPPRKADVEVFKSKSPNSPALARKKLIRELQKLNANFVSVDPDERDTAKNSCSKEFCRLGCVCDSINTDKRVVDHCGKVECMFSCVCPSTESASSTAKHVIIGSDTVSRLQEESSRHMAKVERYFHNTVVEAAGELVLPGRQQRERRLPKRFLDSSLPEVLSNPKKPKTSDLSSKTAVDQPPLAKKLLQPKKTPQYKKCSVFLGRIPNSEAHVRCLFHSRVGCPCLTFRSPGRVSRNVAMKSTTGVKQFSSTVGLASSVNMEDFVIPEESEQNGPETTTYCSFLEGPEEPSVLFSDSEVLTDIGDDRQSSEEEEISSNVKQAIRKESHKENTSPEKGPSCKGILISDFSIDYQDLQCARTAGVNFWVSQRCSSKAKEASRTVPTLPEEEPKVIRHITKEIPRTVPCLPKGVSKDVVPVVEDVVEAAIRVEDATSEAGLQSKDGALKVIPQEPVETVMKSVSDTDLGDLVQQDDSMPLFKIVEVKSLPPSSFEADLIAPTESDEKDVTSEMRMGFTNTESFDYIDLDTGMPVEGDHRSIDGQTGASFASLEMFDLWLKSNETLCGDLEKMCSKSLKLLPMNSVIIMKWSHLNKLSEGHSAHLWIRQRFGSNSHIFVTQKDRPPDAACVNFLDLEKKEALSAKVASLLRGGRIRDPSSLGCAILVSKGCFWEISGHIKFGKAKRNDMQKLVHKKGFFGSNNFTRVIHKPEMRRADISENAVNEVGQSSRSSKMLDQLTTTTNQFAEVCLNDSSAVMSPLEVNAPTAGFTKTVERADSIFERSDYSECVVKVQLDLETSVVSILENHKSPNKNSKPKSNIDNLDCDFGKDSTKDRTSSLTAAGNEHSFQRHCQLLSPKPRRGKGGRSNPMLLLDSELNLERVPGTLSKANIKQSSKMVPGLSSQLPTLTAFDQSNSSLGEKITSTSNLYKLGIFTQSLEPPLHILEYEDIETGVLSQQQLNQNSIDSLKKREENSLKPCHSENKNDLLCNGNVLSNSKETTNCSLVPYENANSIQEAKNANSTSETEIKGSPAVNTNSGNAFTNVKPPVLIIDLKKLRHSQTASCKKNTPVAIRVTELKKLTRGFDAKNRVDSPEKISPTVGINPLPQMKVPSLPAVLHTSQQNPMNQEKVIISKTMPMQYSVCTDSVVVTCPSRNFQGGTNIASSKAIHVNIIKEPNPTTQVKKNIVSSDGGSPLKVAGGGVKVVSEKPETQISFVEKRLELSTVDQSISFDNQERGRKPCYLRKHTLPQISILPVVSKENNHTKNKEAPTYKLNDLNSVSSGHTKSSSNKPQSKEVTVNAERSRHSLVSCDMLEGMELTHGKTNIPENIPKMSRTEMKKDHKLVKRTSHLREGENDEQLHRIQSMFKTSSENIHVTEFEDNLVPSETSDALPSHFHKVFNLENNHKQVNIKKQETLLQDHTSLNEDGSSSAKNCTLVETNNAMVRRVCGAIIPSVTTTVVKEGGPSALDLNVHNETALKSVFKSSHISAPIAANILECNLEAPTSKYKVQKKQPVFRGIRAKGQRKPVRISGKQLECDDGANNEANFMQDATTKISKNVSVTKISKLEVSNQKEEILSPKQQGILGDSKSPSTTKEIEVHNSFSHATNKESLADSLHHSLSSSCDTSASITWSSPKISNLSLKKVSTPFLKFATHSPKKASTQSPENVSTHSLEKASTHIPKRESNGSINRTSLDSAALLNMNLDVSEASSSLFTVDETEVPDISALDDNGNSPVQRIHHPTSPSCNSYSSKPLKKASTKTPTEASPECPQLLNLNMDIEASKSPPSFEGAEVPNPSLENSIAQHVHHPPMPSFDMHPYKTRSPKKVSSDCTQLPTVDQNIPETSKSPSPVKKALVPNHLAMDKEKEFKIPYKPFNSSNTSMSEKLPLKKVTSVCSLSPNTPELTPKSSSNMSNENESFNSPLLSSDDSSPHKIQRISLENDVIWYRLDLNDEFDRLVDEESGFSASISKLLSAVTLARNSNRTVRLVFDRSRSSEDCQQFKKGVYAVPKVDGTYVRIGPYKHNEPIGVKTLKKMKNHQSKVIHNLLRVEVVTPEADCVPNGVDPEKTNSESNKMTEAKDNSEELKLQENKDCDNVLSQDSTEGSKKISCEEAQIKCMSFADKTNDEPPIPIEEQKNADPFSSGVEIPVNEHSIVLRKIPKVSLLRLSVDNEIKKHGTIIEQTKMNDDVPPAKKSIGDNPDLNHVPCVTKCGGDDSKNLLERERFNAKKNGISPVTKTKVTIDPLVTNERTDSNKPCNTSDVESACISSEKGSLIYRERKSSASSLQVNGLAVNITDEASSNQFKKNIAPSKGSAKENESVNFVKEVEVPSASETLHAHEFPNSGRRKMNVARKSTTINRAFMEKALLNKLLPGRKMDTDLKVKENAKIPSEKLLEKAKSVNEPLITVNESDIQSEEMYDSGYLIPHIPKLAPIPAKKCLIPSESSVIVIEDPARPGVYVKFGEVEEISNYINHILHRHIRFFPPELQIKWTYCKQKPSTSPPGLIQLKNLSKDMFITCKGVFKYSNNNINAKKSIWLTKDEEFKTISAKQMEEVENARVQLLSLFVPQAKVSGVSCEKTIKKAMGEISFLQSHNELLSQINVVEKKKKLQLDEKLKALLKAHEVKTFSEFISKGKQLKKSPEKNVDEQNEPNRNPKDLRATGRKSLRGRGRGARKLRKPQDYESTETVTGEGSQTVEAGFTDSNNVQEKEGSKKKTAIDAVPLPKRRILRSSRNTCTLVVPPEKSEKPAHKVNQIRANPVPEANQLSDHPAPEVNQLSDKPAPEVSQISDKPAPEVSQISDKPASEVSQISDKPAPEVSQISNKPASEVSQISDKPAPEVSRISDKPAPEVSRISDKPAPEVSRISDKPAPEVSQISDKPAPEVSRICDKPAPEVSQISDKPAPEVSRISDKPAPEVNEISDQPAPEVNQISDNPIPEVNQISDNPVPDVNLPSTGSSSVAVETSSTKEKVISTSPETVRKCILSVVHSTPPDDKSDTASSKTANGVSISCDLERRCEGNTSRKEQAQHSSGVVKSVDAYLWKKSFSRVKINSTSLRSGTRSSTAETSAQKRRFLRKKIDLKQRTSLRHLEVSGSISLADTASLSSKKRRS